ncbi:MAG: SOS response-associated peptidase [Pirellulales bacterium]|nr:SOS response-associated peptidase [Pirellulales bacterium]
MCGRFSLRARLAELLAEFVVEEQNAATFLPRYNIAPSQPVFAVREKPGAPAPAREAVLLRWGLIPSWAADPAIGNRTINARVETVAEKPAFRAALKRRRCLVAADGFYEWKAEGKIKQPYFIHFADDRPFAFAGLWESWEASGHSRIESCTILTTEANELMRPIHHRMPVILRPDDYARWLDPSEQDSSALQPLLISYAGDGLEAYPVGRLVNNPRHDDQNCLTRVM